MKKHIVVAAGLAVLSTGAFASKARMQALSQGDTLGSYYMNDNRNIWRTAGAVNSNTNFVITEWSGGKNDETVNADAQPEGGFFKTSGALNYGLYLNADAYGSNIVAGQNPSRFDVFVGSSEGMNWGARVGYSSFTNGDQDGSAFDFGVSADLGAANVWLNMAPGATTTLTAGDTEFNMDMTLGATMGMGDYTLFAEYASEGGTGEQEAATSLTVGAGRSMTNDNATLFYDVKVMSESNIGHDEDVSKLSVPVTFGAEVKASSWLTWRASLSQSLFGALDQNGSETSARTTTLGAGASLTWGALQLDGTLSSASAGNLGTDSNLMSNVSATYRF